MKVLFLCTVNSCNSQIAEGFLRSFDPALEVYSAGTQPASKVHPKAIQIMEKVGIEYSLSASSWMKQGMPGFFRPRHKEEIKLAVQGMNSGMKWI